MVCTLNILFILKSLDIGGLEVVTAVLANKFVSEGHHVSVYAFEKRSGKALERFDKNISITIAGEYKKTKGNIDLMRQILVSNQIEVVVNQWGLPLIPIKTLYSAKKGLQVKIISVYHNDPLQNGRIQGVETQILMSENTLKRMIFRVKKLAYRCVTGFAMRYIYQHSEVFEVLSPSFISHFQEFTRLTDTSKLVVQANPITIDFSGFEYRAGKKQKEIVYVGRVDYIQKRVYRVIEVWAQLEKDFPDWRLTIVGDGEEKANVMHMVEDLELQNVHFEGFQQPRAYYERASILILTSEFEGFGLVLVECMSFGVVPIVYGSYSAVYDIIENDVDGIIIPKTQSGFDAHVMAERIKSMLADDETRNRMALAAIEKSKKYSIDKIYEQWMKVLNELQNN